MMIIPITTIAQPTPFPHIDYLTNLYLSSPFRPLPPLPENPLLYTLSILLLLLLLHPTPLPINKIIIRPYKLLRLLLPNPMLLG